MPADTDLQRVVNYAAQRQPAVLTPWQDRQCIADAAARGAPPPPPDPEAEQRAQIAAAVAAGVAAGRVIGQQAGYEKGARDGADLAIRIRRNMKP